MIHQLQYLYTYKCIHNVFNIGRTETKPMQKWLILIQKYYNIFTTKHGEACFRILLRRILMYINFLNVSSDLAEKSSINQHGFQAGPGWFMLVCVGIVLAQAGLCWNSADPGWFMLLECWSSWWASILILFSSKMELVMLIHCISWLSVSKPAVWTEAMFWGQTLFLLAYVSIYTLMMQINTT